MDTNTAPRPQAGTWTLTAPDGRQWQADRPLLCCAQEQRERIPPEVALARIAAAAAEAQPISDAVMDLVDRLGSEAADVDPRAWEHLRTYLPHSEALTDEQIDLVLQRSPIQANYGDLMALARAVEREVHTANAARVEELQAEVDRLRSLSTRAADAELGAQDAQIESLRGLLRGAYDWIDSARHGDNCFVSDHYEGDPGNRCNCGKDALLPAIDAATLTTERHAGMTIAGDGAAELGRLMREQRSTRTTPAPQA